MGLLILFFSLSIFFSFLCSILEAVLLSITPSYVRKMASENPAIGELLQEYKKDIDRPLSAILTLNTIAHTVGAIGVGAIAGELWGANSIHLGPVSMSYESIVATVMTLAILVLSEIIPKTIGANNWQSLAPFTIKTLKGLLFILAPFVWMSQVITKSLKKNKEESVLSRADFAVMTRIGGETGALNEGESRVIKNLLEFEKLTVRDIMTPKTVMLMAQEDTPLKEFFEGNNPIPYSRIPLYSENRDTVSGFFLKNDLLLGLVRGDDDKALKTLERKADYIDDEMTLPDFFNHLHKSRAHLSVVVDDFGMVVGLITMEDLFETLLGMEIVDESDMVVDLQELARKKWKDKSNSPPKE